MPQQVLFHHILNFLLHLVVYYYRIEENKGGELEIFTQHEIVNHNPKQNDLIVFNSDTFHSVKPYYGNNDRIAIAWDAIYTF